jgi:serine/threonine-protein kinase
VDYRGRVKLIDFGIARELDAPVSSPGRLRGKLGYLSPEQARGDRTDQRSDLFSLAVIMAELALQCRLFSGETPAELVSQALRADLSTLERAGSRVPFELELILSIALDADPEERFQSANELREVLDELVRLQSWTVPSARSVASWLRANRILEPVSGVRSIMLPGWLRAGSDENRHSA